MVTKVLIDINDDRDPVIRLSGLRDCSSSDDVKDKLVKVFSEILSGNLAVLQYPPHSNGNDAVVSVASMETVLVWLLNQFSVDDGNHKLVRKIVDNYCFKHPVVLSK